MAFGQNLPVGVTIVDGRSQVNQIATYRFTLIPQNLFFQAGTIIQTTFPPEVNLTLNSQDQVEVCSRYIKQTSTSQSLVCNYDKELRQLTFKIDKDTPFDVAYEYDVGKFVNPGYSTYILGIDIQIKDSNSIILSQSGSGATILQIVPGSIINNDLEYTSKKVSDPCTYTFEFSITNDITPGGLIKIDFPAPQITVPSLTNSMVSLKIYDQNSITPPQISTPSNSLIISGAFSNGLVADSSKKIQIQIQSVINPGSLQETKSFQISTLNSDSLTIDQVSTGMTVKPDIPGVISVRQLYPQPYTVGQQADLSFNIQIPQVYTSGYLLITLPPELEIVTLTCQILIGFFQQTPDCQLVNSDKHKIRVNNQPSSTTIYFVVGKVQNPSNNKTTSSLQIQSFDAQNFLQSQILSGLTYTPTPGSLSEVSAIREKTQIGASRDNSLTFSIKTMNILSSGSQIVIKIPTQQAQIQNNNSLLIQCQTKVDGGSFSGTPCQVDYSKTDYFQISLKAPCSSGCSANSRLSVQLTGIQNPQWKAFQAQVSVEIYTQTSDFAYTIDQIKNNLFITPDLIEGPLSSVQIYQSGSHVVGSQTSYNFTFTIEDSIPQNGLIRLYFPTNAVYLPTSGGISCSDILAQGAILACKTNLNSGSQPQNYVNYIEITGMCPNGCPSQTQFRIAVQKLVNPSSVKNVTNNFAIRTLTSQGYYIDLANVTDVKELYLVPSQFSSLALTSPSFPIIVGASTAYNIQIVPRNSIDQYYGKIEIRFPDEVSLDQASTCSATASNQVLKCQYDSGNNLFTLTNPNSKILSGTAINFGTQAINPLTTKRSNTFNIQSYYLDPNDNSNQYIVESDSSSLTIQPDTPNLLKNVTVMRSISESDDPSDFYLDFITTNPIPKGSTILISLPSDQILIQKSKSIQFFSIDQNKNTRSSIQIQSQNSSSSSNYIEIGLLEWCTQDDFQTDSSGSQLDFCPPGTQLKIKITNVKNPPTTKPPSQSFRIVTQTSDGYQIDAITQNIFASPILSSGPFQGVYIDQSVNYVGASTSLKISVIINDDITTSQGSIRLTLPPNLYYVFDKQSNSQQSDQIACFTEDQPTNCTFQTQGTNIGSYVSQLNINLNCSSKPCLKDTNRTVTIQNIRNKFNTAALTTNTDTFQISTLDIEGYTVNAQAVSMLQTNLPSQLIPNNNATILQAVVSNVTTGAKTSITLDLKIETRLQSNSFIQISIPIDQFTIETSSIISCQDYKGMNIQCTNSYDSKYLLISYQNSSLSKDQSIMRLQINGLTNRYNTLQVLTPTLLSTFTPNMDAVDKSKDNYIIMANLTQARIQDLNYSLTNTIVGAKTEFQISFKAQNGILPGDKVNVTFSDGMLISSGDEQCAITINGQKQTIQKDQYQIQTDIQTQQIVSFIVNVPSEVTKDQSVILSLINITNLLQKKPLTTNISVQILTDPTTYVANGNISLISQDILQPNQFSAVNFIRLDSPKLQTKTDVEVKVSVPINTLPNSKFSVSLPDTQFIGINEIQCLSQGDLIDCKIFKSNDGNTINITTSSSFCTRLPWCSPQEYSFTLKGLQNPQQVSPDIQSIKIQMLTSNDTLVLDSSPTAIFASPPLQVGDLLDVQISQPGSLITGLQTQYDFSFKLPLSISNSSQLILRFPNMTIFADSAPIAIINKALNQSYSYANVQNIGTYITSIILDKFCQQIFCNKLVTQEISVSNIRNVEFVRPRNKQFQIQIITESGFVLNQNDYSETALPVFIENQLQEVTIVRDSKQLSQSSVNLTISFKTPNRIPDGSYIILQIPLEQVTLQDFKTITCIDSKISSLIINCKYVSSDDNYAIYNISEWCIGDCQANQTLSMVIKNTQNPSQLASNFPDSFFDLKVYTQDGYLIEKSSEDLVASPQLSGIPINNITMTRENNIVGKDDFLTFVIPISTLIDVTADMVLNFTQGQFLRPSDQELPSTQSQGSFTISNDQKSIYCEYTYYDESTTTNVNFQYGIQSIQSITVPNVCTQQDKCESGTTITLRLKIRNLLIPLEVNKNAIKLSLKSTVIDLGMGIITNNLSQLNPNLIDVQLKDQASYCNSTGALCPLEMVITTSNPVPSDSQSSGLLIIQIPQQMIIRASECTAYLMDIKIICFVNDQQYISIKYQLMLTTLTQTSYVYRVTIQSLENPYSTSPSDLFNIYTQLQSNNKPYIIDSLQSDLRIQVTNIGLFDKIQISRSNAQLDSPIDLMFNIQNRNRIPNNGSLFISIPASQATRISDDSQQCNIKTNSNKPLKCAILNDGIIQVDGICADSNIGCTQDQLIVFTLQGQYKNPVFLKDPIDIITDSVNIYSAYKSNENWYKIDQTQYGLFIAPDIAIEKLILNNIVVTSIKTSEYTNLTLQASHEQSGKTFQSSNLRIKFDAPLFNANPIHTIYASINSKASEIASIQYQNDQFSRLVTYITLKCDETCIGSQSLNIQITGLQNPYYTTNDNSLAGSQLYLQELQNLPDQVISQGSISLVAPVISKLQLSPISQTLLIPYNPNTTQENTIDIQFSLANNPLMPQNATVSIILPKEFSGVQQADQIKCSNIFTDLFYKCSYYTNNSIIIENYYSDYAQSNNVIALKLQGIMNPPVALKNAVFTVSINQANQIYAYDDKQLLITIGNTSSSFCNSNSQCSQCFEGGACASCNIPSDNPLLLESKCVYQCPVGYFENNLNCYKCAEGCKECSSFGQCSTCDNSKIFIDGSCDSTLQCPAGTKLDTNGNQCIRTTGCDTQCSICGVSPSYCYTCSQGLQSMNGLCFSQCPSTYFSNDKKQCIKCNSLCGECSGNPNKCTSCRKESFDQSILDLVINSCVSSCSSFSTPRKSDPLNFCDPCGDKCYTCFGEPNNCTSCFINKKTQDDLFYVESQGECVQNCPVGSQEDYNNHICEKSSYKFSASPPIYLLLSILFLVIITALNKIVTGCDSTKSADVALAFLTFIEFLNRVFLLANLWFSTKNFSFCVTGVDILGNAFLSIYFVTLVVQPIAKQIQAIETQSHIFSSVVVLSQFSGINSIRLITSQFMGLIPLSNRYTDILYYVKQLEILSILSSILCIFQLFVGVSCIFDFGPAKDAFGFGINAIVFNIGLLVMQTQKYYLSLSAKKVYQSVESRPQ